MGLRGVALVRVDERTTPEGKEVANKILLTIPVSEYRMLRPSLQYVALTRHDSAPRTQMKECRIRLLFPMEACFRWLSLRRTEGRSRLGIAGKEGIVGLASAVGLTKNPLREIVQISGDGFKVPVGVFRKLLQTAPSLQMILSRYAVLYGLQVSQTAACNRLHDAEQRLARWLLMTQDRVDTPVLRITHDFLATMLGTDRPTISLAAADLQKLRMIQYLRGSVKILNRKKLEKAACECYGVVKEFNADLGLE